MFAKKSISRVSSILLAVLLLSGTASASPLNAALGTGFTYQGKLTDGGRGRGIFGESHRPAWRRGARHR